MDKATAFDAIVENLHCLKSSKIVSYDLCVLNDFYDPLILIVEYSLIQPTKSSMVL